MHYSESAVRNIPLTYNRDENHTPHSAQLIIYYYHKHFSGTSKAISLLCS